MTHPISNDGDTSGAAENQPAPREPGRRRRRRVSMAVAGSATALVVAAVVVGIKLTSPARESAPSTAPLASAWQATRVVSLATGVPGSVLRRIGTAGVPLPSKISHGATRTVDGRPQVLYVGAEFCPYCAAERWPLMIALGRFGTFSGVQLARSSSQDVYPNTHTVSFYESTYKSAYLTFTPVETADKYGHPLQHMSQADTDLFNAYDRPPYSEGTGGIPFIDFGDRYVFTGASYDPGVLHGLSWSQIAAAVHRPNSIVAQDVDGGVNVLTAVLCELTGDQPAAVCQDRTVAEVEGRLR